VSWRVLVTHPGRQHSHQNALALAERDCLAGYWAGVPALAEHRGLWPGRLWERAVRYRPLPLAPELARWAWWIPLLRQLGGRLAPRRLGAWLDFAACRWFDRWVALRLPELRADAVMACEISARETFRVARALGMRTILDAPSLEWRTQDQLSPTTDSPRLHAAIGRVKDEEVLLADVVATVSDFARKSYLGRGLPAPVVIGVPLGADVELFRPPLAPPRSRQPGISALFAGATIRRKGFDTLIEAFSRTATASSGLKLRLAGPRGDAFFLLDRLDPATRGHIEVLGPLDQAALAQVMSTSDVLVLPSRHDSYGMVVPEAMACGLPVIASERVGAAELLVKEGETGWIVPAEDVAALTTRLSWCAAQPAALRAMAPRCRETAVAANWASYRQRFRSALQAAMEVAGHEMG
jgi:glycosyltransferase involved in cell wall biosynthesis